MESIDIPIKSKCFIDFNILDFVNSDKSTWAIVWQEFTQAEQQYWKKRIQEYQIKLVQFTEKSGKVQWRLTKMGACVNVDYGGDLKKNIISNYYN